MKVWSLKSSNATGNDTSRELQFEVLTTSTWEPSRSRSPWGRAGRGRPVVCHPPVRTAPPMYKCYSVLQSVTKCHIVTHSVKEWYKVFACSSWPSSPPDRCGREPQPAGLRPRRGTAPDLGPASVLWRPSGFLKVVSKLSLHEPWSWLLLCGGHHEAAGLAPAVSPREVSSTWSSSLQKNAQLGNFCPSILAWLLTSWPLELWSSEMSLAFLKCTSNNIITLFSMAGQSLTIQ